MNDGSASNAAINATVLDRETWRQPLCTVIVTHHNYARYVGDALRSLIDQTHQRWECIVVDDHSLEDERRELHQIVERLADRRIRVIDNGDHPGQIAAFFTALALSSGAFVSPLDPDDRLDSNFLSSMLAAHLNETVFCSIVNCDGRILRMDGTLLTGTWKGGLNRLAAGDSRARDAGEIGGAPLKYFPAMERHWLWSSSSCLMVRRAALDLMTPTKHLAASGLDGYLVHGAHFLGGSLYLARPLVYRGLHDTNVHMGQRVISMAQRRAREGWTSKQPASRADVVEQLFRNGISRYFTTNYLSAVLRAHFDEDEIAEIGRRCPEPYALWRSGAPVPPPAHWLRRLKRRLARPLRAIIGRLQRMSRT